MNAATAGGILEGPVNFTMTKKGPDGTCEFTRRNSPAKLHIQVASMSAKSELAVYKAQCAGPLYPLKAIGQDAVSCGSRVVGRVRNQAFVKFPEIYSD
jgi:hypothetical protein